MGLLNNLFGKKEPKPAFTDQQALKMIEIIESRPCTSDAREAGALLLQYMNSSSKVQIMIAPEFYASESGPDLLTCYLAGTVKHCISYPADLHNDADDQGARVMSGIRMLLLGYSQVKRSNPNQPIALYEELNRLTETGKLKHYVAEALRKTNSTSK